MICTIFLACVFINNLHVRTFLFQFMFLHATVVFYLNECLAHSWHFLSYYLIRSREHIFKMYSSSFSFYLHIEISSSTMITILLFLAAICTLSNLILPWLISWIVVLHFYIISLPIILFNLDIFCDALTCFLYIFSIWVFLFFSISLRIAT